MRKAFRNPLSDQQLRVHLLLSLVHVTPCNTLHYTTYCMIHTYCKNVPFSRKLRALPIGLGAFSDLGLLRFCLVL